MFCRWFLFVAVSLFSIHVASAGVVNYTMTAGKISGVANGVAFTDANFRITATADTATATTGNIEEVSYVYNEAVCTVHIDGLSPFQIDVDGFGIIDMDYDSIVPGYRSVTFGWFDSAMFLSGFTVFGYSGAVINGGSISGGFDATVAVYPLKTGYFFLTSMLNNGGAFTAVVPEPGTAACQVFGALGVAYFVRRTKKAK